VNSFRFCILAYYLLFPYGESHILAAFLARLAKGNVSFCYHLASVVRTNQKQELPVVAMFVNGSGRNEQS
jgi:hypothetical protein